MITGQLEISVTALNCGEVTACCRDVGREHLLIKPFGWLFVSWEVEAKLTYGLVSLSAVNEKRWSSVEFYCHMSPHGEYMTASPWALSDWKIVIIFYFHFD